MSFGDVLGGLKFGQAIARDKPISEHVPFTRHVADNILLTKSGQLVSIIALDGLAFETMDQDILNVLHQSRGVLWRALGSSQYAMYAHVIRKEVSPSIEGDFPNAFAQELDDRYTADLSKKTQFVNHMFLSIIRRPMQGKLGLIDNLISQFRKGAGGEEPIVEMQRELSDKVSEIVRAMTAYGARSLGIAYRDGMAFSEPSEMLAMLLNGGEAVPMALPRQALDTYIPTKRLFFGTAALEIRSHAGASRFGSMISVKEYPPRTLPGLLDPLLKLPHEFILTQSFAPLERRAAQARIDTYQRQTRSGDDAAEITMQSLDDAQNRLAGSEVAFGDHHLSLLCLSPNQQGLRKIESDVLGLLNNMGLSGVREDLNLEPLFWAQLPTNFSYVARRSLVDTANFAGFFSAHNFPTGRTKGLPWGKPISILRTRSGTPYYFNFHRGDLGNFTVIGPSGSGKTVALGFLLTQALRVTPTPRCVFIDKDRGGEILIRALGGTYEILDPGTQTGFNPFQLPDTPQNRDFLVTLVSFMVRKDNEELSAAERTVIGDAVAAQYMNERSTRHLAGISELLRGRLPSNMDDLSSRLKPWLTIHGWLFNNKTDKLNWSNPVAGFDMTKILEEPKTRTAALLYLFHRMKETLDGKPTLFFLDEGWKLLDDAVFIEFLKDMLKTIRKQNGVIGFGTQSAQDIVNAPRIRSTLVEQTAVNIFFPNPKADEGSYCDVFQLSEKEMQFVRGTDPASRQFMVKGPESSAIVTLDLSFAPDLVKVLSGRTSTVAEMNKLREELGDDPLLWLPPFCDWKE